MVAMYLIQVLTFDFIETFVLMLAMFYASTYYYVDVRFRFSQTDFPSICYITSESLAFITILFDSRKITNLLPVKNNLSLIIIIIIIWVITVQTTKVTNIPYLHNVLLLTFQFGL